jgi:single-strand selective monofunctional uracil DNA glycosylase
MPDTVARIQSIYADLSERVDALSFGPPVTHVYNPLAYAREPAWRFLERAGGARGRVLLLGMNPGPYGMVQTGVPFGTVSRVRGWLGIVDAVGQPAVEHPKRPVNGFDCPREEISGERFWGWAEERFGTPERFFERFFVANYCPLVFMEASGRNRTPDKLSAAERRELFAVCDDALRRLVAVLEPGAVVGVGKFAEDRARAALDEPDVAIARVLHPSPASPVANRGWAEQAEAQLARWL